MDRGPLSVDIYASSQFISWGNSHHSSNDVYEGSESGTTNHGVVLLGWKDDPSVTNGGYWICKNSWGYGWGYSGFFNVAYGRLRVGDRDVSWVKAPEWPVPAGPGPGHPQYVTADFSFNPEYPILGEQIQFQDKSMGEVVLWEWDFNGDDIIDESGTLAKRPRWTYNEEGKNNVSLTVWSEGGLNSTILRYVEVKDDWPPVAIAEPEYYGGQDTEIQFVGSASHCVDDGSIESYYWDFGDGTTSTDMNPKKTYPSTDKIYEVTLTVTDTVGLANSDTCDIRIDMTQPPETVAIIGGCGTEGVEWFDGPVIIELQATDWSGVNKIFYSIDDGPWEEIQCNNKKDVTKRATTLSTHGIHTIDFYAVDRYGNTESEKSEQIKIDLNQPTLDISLSGVEIDGWYITPVEVTLSSNDADSGLEKIVYRVLSLNWEDYTGTFTINNDAGGGAYLECIAIDTAGNTNYKTQIINIDMPPNKPNIDGPTNGVPGVTYNYNFETTDPHLADEIYYWIEWGDETVEEDDWIGPYASGEEVTLAHEWTEQGTYTVRAKAKDHLGAESDWGTLGLSISKNKNPNTQLIIKILQLLINTFPALEPLLGPILENLLN
jgi:PKD repeat protein